MYSDNVKLMNDDKILFLGIGTDLGAEATGSDRLDRIYSRMVAALNSSSRSSLQGSKFFDQANYIALCRPNSTKISDLQGINAMASEARDYTLEGISSGALSFMMGGDHTSSLGPISAHLEHYAAMGRFGVIWIDAHADMNTFETSPSGMAHGMVLASLIGIEPGLSVRDCNTHLNGDSVLLLGTQSIDELEIENVVKCGIHLSTLENIRARSLQYVMENSVEKFVDRHDFIYLSIDLDVLSPEHISAVNTPCSSGLSITELASILKKLSCTNKLKGLDFVEFNPLKDNNGQDEDSIINLCNVFLGSWLGFGK